MEKMSTIKEKSILLGPRAPVPGSYVMAILMLVVMHSIGSFGNSLLLTGDKCVIQEPLYNVTFNLTALDSDLAHHVTSDVNEKFIFDVCDQLDTKCNGVSDGSACLRRKNGSEILLGMKSTLQLVDGRLHFTFTGGESCGNGKNYSFDIILMCSYSAEKEPMNVIPYSSDQCNYFMFWTTIHACVPLPDRVKTNECSVKDSSGHVFNLLPLSHVNHHVPDRNGSHFAVTVCKPVHYGHMTMCAPGSSVCFVNHTDTEYTKKYHDYGQTDPNPTIEEGKLVMNMNSSKETCQDSKIIFECDASITEETPEYVGKEGCTHLFTWRTALACIKKEFCAVVDPSTGLLFNMSSLANQKYTVTQGNMTYEFGICNMSNSQCPGQSGACQLTQNNSQAISVGTINDVLLYNLTGAPYLRYPSGSICNEAGERWSTKIEFICETDNVQKASSPKVVENGGCELIIQLETKLACTRDISCSAMNYSNDEEIDLSPLISAEFNYEALINSSLPIAKDNKQKFILNVCRPLLSKFGLGCPGGSAACLAVQGPNDPTPTNELSLGYPDVSLTIVGERAHLKYLRGDICPQDNSTALSTVIEFYCQPKAGRGLPMLQEILHDCHYRFEWATNAICPAMEAEFRSKSCEIVNNETEVTMDLRKIFTSGELLVNPSKNSVSRELKDGKIQLCDKNVTTVADYKEQVVKIFFTVADASCEGTGGNINVHLRITCGNKNSFDVTEQSACHLILTQVSTQICAFVGATSSSAGEPASTTPSPADNGSTPPATDKPATQAPAGKDTVPTTESSHSNGKHEGSSAGNVVGIILATLTLVSLAGAGGFLVLRNPERREYLRSLFRGRNVLVQYSRVRTNEEASLLMHPPGTLSDSDDEMLI